MSLTSYRAAPPRVMGVVAAAGSLRGAFSALHRGSAHAAHPGEVGLVKRAVLGRSGNDRLSRVLRHSTIGAEEFNGRVRDGIGFGLLAQATGPAKDNWQARTSIVSSQSSWRLTTHD